jgi:exopolysaccharide production protein ExoY
MANYKRLADRSLTDLHYANAVPASSAWSETHVKAVAALLRGHGSAVVFSPGLHGSVESAASDWEHRSLLIHTLPTTRVQYFLVKRIIDVLIVCAMLPCLIPLFLIVALVVRVSSPGPLLYSQKRLGRFGREFRLWKFRSMYVNADEILREHLGTNAEARREWAEARKLKEDPRVTTLGKFLRKASLDELPQLLNVLAGSMSLVGPRPIVAEERVRYGGAYFFYTSAKPGLSGLWQVSGRSDLSYEQRVALDEQYVRSWSVVRDIKILWQTASVVWHSRGAA